ncbi:early nodulin-like protein 1 [Nicotiana sylvestris]|uniref:early nodulin-like protein 1 n=1 Tax=Nicotiana sylvestris TaxID=4096 RepID=UPI00388CB7EA
MGYSTSQKGYRLYNIFTDTFFVSRDVSFKEIVFPFKYPKSTFLHTLSSSSSPTFPVSAPTFPRDDSFPTFMVPLPPATLDYDSPSTSSEHPLSPSTSLPMPSPLHSSSTTSSPIPSHTPASSHILSDPHPILSSAPQHHDLPPTPTAPLRNSRRPSKPPLWLTDFVHQVKPSSSTPNSITDSINYSSLSSSYQTCLSSYSSIIEPTSFDQALTDSNWVQGIET